ncbi:MAG: zf-TFIIB domain-containing protein [Planctomycetota bacterium]
MNRAAQPSDTDPIARCPRDGAEMRKIDVEGIVIDRCETCGGIWLDLGELHRLLSLHDAQTRLAQLDPAHDPVHDYVPPTAEALAASRAPADRGRCPREGQHLTGVRDPQQPHVEYDLCTHCGGTFYDAGELRDLSVLTIGEWVRGRMPR